MSKKFLSDIVTKNVVHGGIDLIITFTDCTFQTVHFKRGWSIEDVTYALLILRLDIIGEEK